MPSEYPAPNTEAGSGPGRRLEPTGPAETGTAAKLLDSRALNASSEMLNSEGRQLDDNRPTIFGWERHLNKFG